LKLEVPQTGILDFSVFKELNVNSGTNVLTYLMKFSTYKQQRNLALNSNKHEHCVKIVAILSIVMPLTFVTFLIYKL